MNLTRISYEDKRPGVDAPWADGELRTSRGGLRPAPSERYGAAEVEKMNEEGREGLLEKLAFDAGLEAFLEGASEEEVEAYRKWVI